MTQGATTKRWRFPWSLHSLRSRLMLLVALAIAPTAVMTVSNGFQEREQAIKAFKENLQRLTNLAAANEAQSIESARQILSDLSSVPDLLLDPDKCPALLADVLKKNEGYINFGLVQLDGNLSCSAVPLLQPVNLADRTQFQRAVSERRFMAGNYVFGRVTQTHTIGLAYPVFDKGGQLRAVVVAALDLASLGNFAHDINLPEGSVLATIDGAGTIISRRPYPELWIGRRPKPVMLAAMTRRPGHPVIVTDTDGTRRLRAFAPVGGPALSAYTVTIAIPADDITKAARHGQWVSLIGLAATTVLALLAAWFAGDVLIVRRVRKLIGTAQRIAAGALDARTGIDYGREEIGSLAQALDEMALALQEKEAAHQLAQRELRAAGRRKDELLAVLAHELRNRLSPISTGAQLLKLMHSENPRIAHPCTVIARQVEHMTRLVDDLLDVSRVTRGQVTLRTENLDLKRAIADALEQLRPTLAARRQRFELFLPAAPVLVQGDHQRLVQVFANLLGNAARYTPEGGNIALTLRQDASGYVVAVADDGIGMEPELVARVFDLFAQAARAHGGLGLGLALVKSLVELHGWSVSAHSAGLGQGSRFEVRLPRFSWQADPGPQPPQRSCAPAADPAPRQPA